MGSPPSSLLATFFPFSTRIYGTPQWHYYFIYKLSTTDFHSILCWQNFLLHFVHLLPDKWKMGWNVNVHILRVIWCRADLMSFWNQTEQKNLFIVRLLRFQLHNIINGFIELATKDIHPLHCNSTWESISFCLVKLNAHFRASGIEGWEKWLILQGPPHINYNSIQQESGIECLTWILNYHWSAMYSMT